MVGYAEEEERLIEVGDLDAATELNIAFWAPRRGRAPETDVPRTLRLEIEEIEEVDLTAVRAPTLVAVGEHDKARLPRDRRAACAGTPRMPSTR